MPKRDPHRRALEGTGAVLLWLLGVPLPILVLLWAAQACPQREHG